MPLPDCQGEGFWLLVGIDRSRARARAMRLNISLPENLARHIDASTPARPAPLRLSGHCRRMGNGRIGTLKPTGLSKGSHTKMEMLPRRVYGFRNFENYRTRVLAHCGWNGVQLLGVSSYMGKSQKIKPCKNRAL